MDLTKDMPRRRFLTGAGAAILSVTVLDRLGGPADAATNTYPKGQCTWLVKELRTDIPNGWGDAGGWATQATRARFGVTTYPVDRAVMVFPANVMGADPWYGHVAFVQYVDRSRGFVTVLEANAHYANDRLFRNIDGVPVLRRVIPMGRIDPRVRFIKPR